MKRLLALTGFTCFAVLTALFYFDTEYIYWIFAVGAILFAVSLIIPNFRREKTLPIAFAVLILSTVWFSVFTSVNVLPVTSAYADTTATVNSTQLNNVYYSGGYYCYEMETVTINNEDVSTKLIIYTKEPFYTEPYDELSFTCELKKTTAKSLIAKGIYLESYIFEAPEFSSRSPEHKPPMYYILKLNSFLKTGLYSELEKETADFSASVFLGDKYSMDAGTRELLRICGLSHIAVVSGLHLSIISALSGKLFGKAVKNKLICALLSMAAIIGFAALTGFGVSVRRAMFMQIILISGRIFSRRADSLNSLGASALAILIVNPYSAGDIGMQLSFLATLGIILWSDKLTAPIFRKVKSIKSLQIEVLDDSVSAWDEIKHYIKKGVLWSIQTLISTLATTFSATLWTMPVLMLTFGGFSLVGIIANVLVIPLLTVVLVLQILCSVLHYISFLPFLADSCAVFVEAYYDYLMLVCNALSKLPYAYISTDEVFFLLWLLSTLLLTGVAFLVDSRRGYKLTALISAFILLASSSAYYISRNDVLTLRIPHTAKGLSVIMESSEGSCLLTLGGTNTKTYKLIEDLCRLDTAQKDLLINIGGENSDLYEEIVLNEFDYTTVLRYDNNIDLQEPLGEYTKGKQETEIITFSGDYTVNLWNKALVQLISSEDCVYEYITASEREILIIPENADIATLPEEYHTPDIIITRYVPDSLGLLSCNTLVVPGDDYTAQATAELASPVALQVVTGTDIIYDIE